MLKVSSEFGDMQKGLVKNYKDDCMYFANYVINHGGSLNGNIN